MRDFVPLVFLWFAKVQLEIAASKSNYMGDPCQLWSIVRFHFPSLKGETVSMQLLRADSHMNQHSVFLYHPNALQHIIVKLKPTKVFPKRSQNNTGPQQDQRISVGTQHLPSMPVSQMARSSCMGTRVASCRTASHWSYWKTSARPGPCRCANGLRGLLGLSKGASNFSPNHTWRQDEGKVEKD